MLREPQPRWHPGAVATQAVVKTTAENFSTAGKVLLFAIVGMLGSYAVAWYGIRVNTYANARTAFAALRGKPWDVVNIPLRAGMSIGLFLISLELIMMVFILLFVDRKERGHIASWDSRSASRSEPRSSASPAVSSPRSPTSAPT